MISRNLRSWIEPSMTTSSTTHPVYCLFRSVFEWKFISRRDFTKKVLHIYNHRKRKNKYFFLWKFDTTWENRLFIIFFLKKFSFVKTLSIISLYLMEPSFFFFQDPNDIFKIFYRMTIHLLYFIFM
uniref:Uncharacterized protein n=1 Tax=Begonia pulchrifolia TaxID=1691898 RepID=A0A5J6E427_9ROSI|nr:hypothetical protein [Begonia pulchrifolia]QEU52820.1 hypothetical protein [Begonia pulchrifolia]